jgi:hypothetical protein
MRKGDDGRRLSQSDVIISVKSFLNRAFSGYCFPRWLEGTVRERSNFPKGLTETGINNAGQTPVRSWGSRAWLRPSFWKQHQRAANVTRHSLGSEMSVLMS